MSKEEYIRIITQVVESPRSDIQKIHRLEEAFNMYVRDTIQPQGIDKDRLTNEITKIADRYCDSSKCEMPCIEDETYICDHANMIGAILDFINQQPTSDGWIPISERLPKNRTTVIVKTSLNCVYVGYRLNNGFYGRDTEHMHFIKDVRAWMPLPQP